jgi:hypothetical protein
VKDKGKLKIREDVKCCEKVMDRERMKDREKGRGE